MIALVDNYFDKTKKNIFAGCRGTILFITKEGKVFQAKGWIEYYREGEIFDDIKTWYPQKHPGHAAATLKIEEIYSGTEKLM